MKETLTNKSVKPTRCLHLLAYFCFFMQIQINRSSVRRLICLHMTQREGHHKTLSIVEFSLLILHKKVLSHFYWVFFLEK